jgi:hypothetical protein
MAIMAMYQTSWRSSGMCKAWILNCSHYSTYSLKWYTSVIVWSLRVTYRKPPNLHIPLCMYEITYYLPVSVALSRSRGATDVLHVFPAYLWICHTSDLENDVFDTFYWWILLYAVSILGIHVEFLLAWGSGPSGNFHCGLRNIILFA